jgi:hypothetical protein
MYIKTSIESISYEIVSDVWILNFKKNAISIFMIQDIFKDSFILKIPHS